MPAMYGRDSNILKETISRLTYKTEYSEQYTGTAVPLHNIRIPSRLRRPAWERFSPPGTSKAFPPTMQPSSPEKKTYNLNINSQGLQPRVLQRSKSAVHARQSYLSSPNSSVCSSTSRPKTSTSGKGMRNPHKTVEILKQPTSLVAPRLQSQMSRFPKTFRYIDKQCFFHPCEESRRNFFVIAPDWVSEQKYSHIRKNNLFGWELILL